MGRLSRAYDRTFRSLRTRNYRLYFFGQIVSLTGTWMQSVAQAWLVLRLTGSGLALGATAALQFTPILLAGPWGGVIADRVDKRRLIIWTQSAAGALALVLGLLTLENVVRLWMVYVLAFLLGVVNLVDMPARQSFVFEMVGPEALVNAVSLNSVVVNGARGVGPAVAGLLIASGGLFSVMGVGAVLGGLVFAARARPTRRLLAGAAVGFGVAIGLAAAAPNLGLATLAMLPIGVASTAFIATSNSLLQLNASSEMR